MLKEYWGVDPEFKDAELGFEENISGINAALVIGDRAFGLNRKHQYVYDLSAIWKEMTGFPFVFAAWVANKKLPQDFIVEFNRSLENGLSNIDEAFKKEGAGYLYCENPKTYLNNKISYVLDAEKLAGMELFLKKI